MDEKSFHLNHNQEKNVQCLPFYQRHVRLLVVDLLAEREAFGRVGVAEIVDHFSPTDVFFGLHTHRTVSTTVSERS